MKNTWLLLMLAIILTSCGGQLSLSSKMNSEYMDKVELGMTKEEVAAFLGKEYAIAEKRIDEGIQIEVLSYRDLYNTDAYYLFVFKNNQL